MLAIAAINALKAYDIIYAMTNGGPANRTQLLSTWMYFLTYNYNQVGLGTAIAVVLFFADADFRHPLHPLHDTKNMSHSLSQNGSVAGKLTKVALFYGALILAALFWLTPVITLILTALKDAGDFAVNGAFSLPKSIRWANFSEAWETGVKNYFWNSVIVAGFKVPIGIVLESMAAFALTHMHFKWADRVFTYILIG